MRIGIVSDIHNNAAGLRAALDQLDDVDEVICVGDVVEEHRFENEAVALLRDRGARCVLGNHDLGLLSAPGPRGAGHVRAGLLAHLERQPTSIDVTVDGKKLVVAHASPVAPHTQYVLPGSPDLRALGEVDADFIVIGHTHAQLVTRVGRALVVNPGSVGQAVDPRNGRRYSFAVLDTATGEATIHDFDVDVASVPTRADAA